MINYNRLSDKWQIFEFSNAIGNSYPEKDIPGPGEYDPKDSTKAKRDFKNHSETSTFASIVEWLKTPKSISPGPGRYFSAEELQMK